jgi:hypothetical protein
VSREKYGARSSRVQIAARVLGKVYCCLNSCGHRLIVVCLAVGTVERAIATMSILSWLSFFGFRFFLSLLSTIIFHAACPGGSCLDCLGSGNTRYPNSLPFHKNRIRLMNFLCPSRPWRQHAQGSQSLCYQPLHQEKNHLCPGAFCSAFRYTYCV